MIIKTGRSYGKKSANTDRRNKHFTKQAKKMRDNIWAKATKQKPKHKNTY